MSLIEAVKLYGEEIVRKAITTGRTLEEIAEEETLNDAAAHILGRY